MDRFLLLGPIGYFWGGLGFKTNSGSTQLVEQFLFSVFSSILSFDLDFIIRPFLTNRGPIASFGVGMVEFNNCFRVSSFIPITFVFLVWLDSNYILEFWVCMVMVVGGWIPAIA